jgi:transcriptional regulator with XRE-family HTH domain
MPRTTRYNHFGASVSRLLAERQMSQAELASALDKSSAYVNQTMTGAKAASAQWADLVADVLNLPTPGRAELHRAAALDHGFKLDLSPPRERRRRDD